MKQHLEAYTVREHKEKSIWTRIGVAFPNNTGGFTLLLNAMPACTDGQYKLVVLHPKEKQSDSSVGDDELNDPYFSVH